MTTVATSTRGGIWLIEDATTESVFTRERLNDEQRLIGQTAEEFIENEVAPALEPLESKDWNTARALLRRCGELGLLATDVPETYGGIDLDKVSSVVVGEMVGRCASFATTLGAQLGLAITPILCFGTDEQKKKYLPRLVAGEIIGAYALSESAARRRLRAQRRKDVDHQRRLRRRVHRLRQS